jgi:signal transduction histidine kinase
MSVTRFDTQDRVRDGGVHEQSTEIRPADAILQHQQEMLSQNEKLAAMSSLLASMAHELNNPLAVIMMPSELLLDETTDMALSAGIPRCQWRSVSYQTLSGHGAAAGGAVHVTEAIRGRLLRNLAFQDSCLPVQSASPRRKPWLKHPAYP